MGLGRAFVQILGAGAGTVPKVCGKGKQSNSYGVDAKEPLHQSSFLFVSEGSIQKEVSLLAFY